jgi:hypothetical protein
VHRAGRERFFAFVHQEHDAGVLDGLGQAARQALQQSLVVGGGCRETPRDVGDHPYALAQACQFLGSFVVGRAHVSRLGSLPTLAPGESHWIIAPLHRVSRNFHSQRRVVSGRAGICAKPDI